MFSHQFRSTISIVYTLVSIPRDTDDLQDTIVRFYAREKQRGRVTSNINGITIPGCLNQDQSLFTFDPEQAFFYGDGKQFRDNYLGTPPMDISNFLDSRYDAISATVSVRGEGRYLVPLARMQLGESRKSLIQRCIGDLEYRITDLAAQMEELPFGEDSLRGPSQKALNVLPCHLLMRAAAKGSFFYFKSREATAREEFQRRSSLVTFLVKRGEGIVPDNRST
ncbi:hypothetical protein J4210_04505 [Candidatus Woesearchaeota archaeon]|nr:hypothetical protein [Candidatus Woesearchaeota archaeon]